MRRVWRDRRANVAMIFAILTPVLVLLGGGTTDLINASMCQSRLQEAADAAAVAAVARASPAYQDARTMVTDGPIVDPQITPGAQAIFNANIVNKGLNGSPSFSVAVTKRATSITAVVTTSGSFKPYFLQLIGMTGVPLAATAKSIDNVPAYIDFYLLLDNTPSMGIGATTADINTMVSHTPDQCAFACHDLSNPNNYYNLAKQLGVTTRINVVAQATASLMTTAINTEATNGLPMGSTNPAPEFRVSVWDFGSSATAEAATQVSPAAPAQLTSNLTQAGQDALGVDLMTQPYQGYNSDRDTDLNGMIAYVGGQMIPPGSGLMPTAPQKVLFLVSDGAIDTTNCAYNNGNSCRQITPINPAICQTIKATGAKIAVLYTTYQPLPTNNFFMTYMWPYLNTTPTQVAQAMQSCATPGLYFEVSPSQGIAQAMNTLFQQVVASVRISS